MEVSLWFLTIWSSMIAAGSLQGILGSEDMVDHQSLHGIGILGIASQLKEHLRKLHPRHGSARLHDVSAQRLYEIVLIMLSHAHATGDIHLSLGDVIPRTFHLSEQTLVACDAIQTEEAHEVHVEGVRMNVRLQFVNANLAVGYRVEA